MESSSDHSFAWTDASNDSIDNGVMAEDNKIKNQSDNESEYGKSYKKKLQKQLFADNEDAIESKLQQKEKKRKHIIEDENSESPRKKKIKLEPESDIEKSGKKNKSKYSESYGLGITSKDSLSNDESYLNLRVKEEIAFKEPSSILSKKKRKRIEFNSDANEDNELSDLSTSLQSRSNDTSCNDIDDISQIMDYKVNQNKEKKKKKKKMKKRKDSSEQESETVFINIKDKFSAEETVVQPLYISNNNDEYSNSSEQVMKNQNALQNRNDNCNSDSGKHINRDKAKSHNKIKICTLDREVISDEDELPVRSDEQQSCDDESVHTKNNKNHQIPEKMNSRISRLSDRIRFEDENNLYMEKSGTDKNVDLRYRKLEKFLKVNENLNPISSKLKNETILTQDDEIWIVKCPHDINVNAFQDITIPLDKKCKIKVDGGTYEGSIEDHMNTVTVLSQVDSRFVLKNLLSKAIINFRKRVPKVHIRDDIVMLNNQTDFIPLPETKLRHPLFGSNYKKAIKISGAIKERLEANLISDKRTKNTTKQKKNIFLLQDAALMLNIETKHEPQSSECTISDKKKGKKLKNNGTEGLPVSKQAKQERYDNHSAEVWDSEKAIEENLFNF